MIYSRKILREVFQMGKSTLDIYKEKKRVKVKKMPTGGRIRLRDEDLPPEYEATSAEEEKTTRRRQRNQNLINGILQNNGSFTPPYSTGILPNRSIFSDNFRTNHLKRIQSNYETQALEEAAREREVNRSRQLARGSGQSIPANTLIGITPHTERFLEGYLRNPSTQQQLRNEETVQIPFPHKGAGGFAHRTMAVTIPPQGVYGQPNSEIYDQPPYMTVKGRLSNSMDPNSGYEVHHLEKFR